MVRMRLICVGDPAVVMPARFHCLFGVSFSVVRTRLGSSRSSKKMSRTSSCVMVNSKSSSPSAKSAASLPRPPPSPEGGFLISSPGENCLLPGRTKSCSPPALGSSRKRGSLVPLVEMRTLRSFSMSATAESFSDFCTASRICVRARRRKRWRLPRLLPLGLRRRSMKWVMARWASARLVHAHVPFHEPPHLARGIAARQHALDELVVLGLGVAVLLGLEADDRQQILDLREHALLDDAADLLIGRP